MLRQPGHVVANRKSTGSGEVRSELYQLPVCRVAGVSGKLTPAFFIEVSQCWSYPLSSLS